jgi:citrate lyase subunit beta/citryl-CoA lyase
MRSARSLLFVPGHKADWIHKALNSAADAIIIDLEDAVPEESKALARSNAVEIIERGHAKTILVRPNALDTQHFAADVLAVSRTGLDGLVLPKLYGRDDVVRFDALITAGEIANGAERDSIEVIPCLETAASLHKVDEILTAPRVAGIMAAAAKDGDVAREVGFTWTEGGQETLYFRSKVVLAARAHGIRNIVLGLWQDVHNLEGLQIFGQSNAQLGYTGLVLIHPSHAPIANQEFGLTDKRRDYYTRLVAAFEAAEQAGNGAVSFDGEHIDLAHANHARELLRIDAVSK